MLFRRRRLPKGQALVEFALALPLLVLLLVGLAQFGFLLYAHVQVTNAAREAARAGSLYLGSRFHYTVNAGGTDCWSLRQWVENALVDAKRDAQGCPTGAFQTAPHAFGNLNAAQCLNAATDDNCWWLEPLTSNGTVIPVTPRAATALTVGDPLEVNLLYRYQMPLVTNIFPFLEDTVVINKTVIMRIQVN